MQRIKVIENAVAGKITVREAAENLNLSERQVKRKVPRRKPSTRASRSWSFNPQQQDNKPSWNLVFSGPLYRESLGDPITCLNETFLRVFREPKDTSVFSAPILLNTLVPESL